MSKTLLTTHDIAYATSTQVLFSKIFVSIKDGDRIGLIGKNGTGKTSFLKILSGQLEADSGTVIRNGSVGYVPQIAEETQQHVTVEELLQSTGCTFEQFTKSYKKIFSSKIPSKSDSLQKMSGGQLTKLWIATISARKPSVLLLDEPTNHLDQRSIDELIHWIKVFEGAVVFVSHNRSFLSQVTNIVWELKVGSLTVFGGNYNDYLLKTKHDNIARERQIEATKKELESLERGVKMREVKANRATKVSMKNKTEPSRSKSAENYFRNRSEKGIGSIKAKQDDKRTELEASLNSLQGDKKKTINIPLDTSERNGRLLLDTKGLAVTASNNVLISDVELRIEYGDRLAISGDNGVGKTILIKEILRELDHPTSDITKVGKNVKYAFIDQHYNLVNKQLTVFENIKQTMNSVDSELIYKQIGRFQFPEYYVHKKASELSGGEVARLAFAIVTTSSLDLLVLDEPTNNLDIETIDIITEALRDFRGSLIVVSHDTSFVNNLNIKQRYKIHRGKFINY